MESKLTRVPEGKGVLEVPVQGLEWIRLYVATLEKGERLSLGEKERELGCLLTTGEIEVNGKYVLGPRREIFNSKPWGIYVPPGKSVDIKVLEDSELVFATAKSEPDGADVVVISPEEIDRRVVGVHNWKRYVTQVIDNKVGARHIIMGETVNPPGNWSSYPPHKHDKHNPPYEWKMEEVYLYRLNPPGGFGLQRIYTEEGDVDVVYPVTNNTVLPITRGYHPVVAAPGYSLYYLWVLGGEDPVNIPRDDTRHAWVKWTEQIVREL
ncbi:MAG TPA: 5-deoxy-glucuronate isomerase [bacterium]|nr:5-deoxy-glucuronate isomerase [bacterium]